MRGSNASPLDAKDLLSMIKHLPYCLALPRSPILFS